jgi:uncharacterized protein YodC (DUF2158 family)
MVDSLKVGDVVELKSGSPSMTVMIVGVKINCTWFKDGEPKNYSFERESLKKIILADE